MKIAPHAALTMVASGAELCHAVTDADREPVAPAKTGTVAACAGLRRTHRQSCVEIELLAQRGLFGRVGIVLREWNRQWPAILRLDRVDAAGRLLAEIDLARLADDRVAEADLRRAENTEASRCDGGRKQN
jgi:hypothetical protein